MITSGKVKFRVGNYLIPVVLEEKGSRIFCHFSYNKILIDEIRCMQGAKYHGFDEDNPQKVWSIANSLRNQFQLERLTGGNPYANYDKPLIDFTPTRPLRKHQVEMCQHGLTYHYCIYGCEMGTGKTLAAIETIERAIMDLKKDQIWYISTKGGLRAVKRELIKWDAKFYPNKLLTYQGLTKVMKELEPGTPAPRIVVFDESSKIKTPTAQCSQAAMNLASAVRTEWGVNGFVILMTGTPAPKNPTDWWHQVEVTCPGFTKEGDINKFRANLSIIENRESITGGVYPHLVTWKDSTDKCAKCGGLVIDNCHMQPMDEKYHPFIPCVNEVERLYRRLKGLVIVRLKKDCLDLPEKQYQILEVNPLADTLRVAKIIKQTSPRVITALTLLRELSDGFQYSEKSTGEKLVCPNCKGNKQILMPTPVTTIDPLTPFETQTKSFKEELMDCDYCGGSGEVSQMERTTDYVNTPKDDVFIDLLDEHEDGGRFIVWGGFQGTINKLSKIAMQEGWCVLRVDGRGFFGFNPQGQAIQSDELLDAMDLSHPKYGDLLDKYPKVCYVGHPRAGGMALTLTASPTELFYSNDFSGEARFQAEDRFHRDGMDLNRGATIIDIIHLPSDRLVLENLKKKRKLQDMSMGELSSIFGDK